MNRRSLIILLLQSVLGGCAIVMAILIETSWLGIVGMTMLAVSSIIAAASDSRFEKIRPWLLPAAVVSSFLVPIGLCLSKTVMIWDTYHGLMAWMLAFVVLPAAFCHESALKKRWRILGIVWAFVGCALQFAGSYLQNEILIFCLAVLAGIILFVVCRIWFRPGFIGIQVVNTLILLFVALPVADVVLRVRYQWRVHSDPENYYSFEAAQKNPAGYALWTRYIDDQWVKLAHDIFRAAPELDPPYHLIPGSHTVFFKCPISINHLGFRGAEFSPDKGDTYRIVTIGESTTFGATIKKEDRPWPEVLEQLIRERVKTRRPVQVINAGVPSYNLETNLRRLASEILPLKPDMIISYHGYNGFKFIDGALPLPVGKAPPVYLDRPLKILGDLEYSIKLMRYKKRMTPAKGPAKSTIPPPMETRYARDYRELGQLARTNHIRLVVANYSMAVNSNSAPALIEFYRGPYPHVREQIHANAIHSEIVHGFAQENPEVCLVDTHPNLDDHHEKFIDLVHLTQPGRQQLAETIFANIQKILEQDLTN